MSDPTDFDDLSEEGTSRRPGLPVDPGRLWLSLKRGWRWLPIGTAAGAVVGLLVAFLAIDHSFKSETILIWEPAPGANARDLGTHAGVLVLPSTLAEVKRRLELRVPIELLRESIDVWYDDSSSLVTVEATGETATGAQRLARTSVEVFLDQQNKLGKTRAQELAQSIETDLEGARKRLAKARKKYDEFRTEHGISDIEAEAAIAISAAEEIKAQRERAQTDLGALDARMSKLDKLMRTQRRTSVQSASSMNPAVTRLAEQRAELASLQARLSADHPRIAALKAQIASLEKQAESKSEVVSNVVTTENPEFAAMRQTLSASEAERAAALERQRSYEELAKEAAKRVATLSAIEGEARELKSDVQLAETRVGELEQQLSQARAAATSPIPEFRVLTPALLPDHPERSQRRLVLVGLTLFGLIVGFGYLVVRPLRDGRVYTAREAAFWSRFPVVGSTTWPLRRDMFFTFVDELNDSAALSRGTTLVVGAGDVELPLARELAYWLGPAPERSAAGEAGRPGEESMVAQPQEVRTESAARPASVSTASAGRGAGATAVASQALTRLPAQGTALAHRSELLPAFYAWSGELEGPNVRRAARMADRVLVLVQSGAESVPQLATLGSRLGRDSGIGMVVVGLSDELLKLPDRAGDVQKFWR